MMLKAFLKTMLQANYKYCDVLFFGEYEKLLFINDLIKSNPF